MLIIINNIIIKFIFLFDYLLCFMCFPVIKTVNAVLYRNKWSIKWVP